MTKIYEFSLPDQDGNIFSTKKHLPLIIYFYPRDNTPGCTNESIDFSNHLNKIKQLGYTLVGISRDTIQSHQKFIKKYDLKTTLLSDVEEKVCNLFNVIKEKNMYGKKVFGIERSTFILNNESKIIHEWRKVKIEGHVQEVIEVINTI